MKSFISAISTKDFSKVCSAEKTLKSHLVVFAAENSRKDDEIANLSW